MKANKKFVEEEEAVSAVIGVILMVAITVAIAATVYVYVSSMTGGSADVAPSVTFQIKDGAADDTDTGAAAHYTDGEEVLTLEHLSGAKLTMADLKIQYKNDDLTTWQDLAGVGSGQANGIESSAALPTYFELGDELSLIAVTTDGTPNGDYSFRILHKPSNSQILTETTYTAD